MRRQFLATLSLWFRAWIVVAAALSIMLLFDCFVLSPEAAMMRLAGWCHQLPERSFSFRGLSLALCARCVGLYVGLVLATIQTAFLRPRISRACVLISLGIVDKVVHYTLGIDSSNAARTVAGLALGFGIVELLGVLADLARVSAYGGPHDGGGGSLLRASGDEGSGR